MYKRAARHALRAARMVINRMGYQIVPFSQSTSSSAGVEIIDSSRVGDGQLNSCSIASLAKSFTLDSKLKAALADRIANLDGDYRFPILGAGDSDQSVNQQLNKYVSQRFSDYEYVVSWVSSLNLEMTGKSMIDIGTCVGVLPFFLKTVWPASDVFGADSNADYVKIAQALFPEIEFLCASFYEQQGKFDAVFFTEVLEHMANPSKALRALALLLKPKGRLILSVPDGRWDQMGSYKLIRATESYGGHINFWSVESFYYFLRDIFPSARVRLACIDRGTIFACVEPD